MVSISFALLAMLFGILSWEEFNCRSNGAFFRLKKEIKEPLVRSEFVTLLWNTNPIFASRIHCRNKRSTDALMAFSLRFSALQAIPTTTYRLSTLFPFIVEKRKAGWRMFRKMQQIYILTNELFSFSMSGKTVHCNW